MHPLLAAILAAPDGDLTHHAVYADALQSSGDPRGELIAIELALAAAPARSDLLARRAELRASHGGAWWPGVPDGHVRTRHGFVEAVAITADQIELAVDLAAREPLRSLEFRGPVPPEVFARVPRVRALVAHELGDDGLQALLAAPCARALAELDVSGSDASLMFSPMASLPNCRRLSIAATWIEAYGFESWRHAGELRELSFSLPRDRYFDSHRVLALMPKLERLEASCVQDFASAEVRAVLARLPHLRHLEVIDNDDPIDVLRAALPQATIVDAVPERVTLDLVGDVLAFDRTGAAYRNGQRVPIHVRYSSGTSMSYGTRVDVQDPEPVRLLVDALACGAPRKLTPTGCKLAANLLPYDNIVTATIDVHDTRIDLDLDHYVD